VNVEWITCPGYMVQRARENVAPLREKLYRLDATWYKKIIRYYRTKASRRSLPNVVKEHQNGVGSTLIRLADRMIPM